MERLGLGPAECAARNPRLVYGRMTGWGQHGPLAQAAGHDLNYVALTGLLSLSARHGERPILPPTVVGDAAGALGLAFGIACGLFEARASGHGRVVDAAIVDVVAMLGALVQWIRASGQIDGELPSPFHDSPFYDVYECADGRCVTIGALEPQFYALLLSRLGLADVEAGGAVRPRAVAGAEGAPCRTLSQPAARRVVCAARRQRRLLRPGAQHRRGGGAPAQRRARRLRGPALGRSAGRRGTALRAAAGRLRPDSRG